MAKWVVGGLARSPDKAESQTEVTHASKGSWAWNNGTESSPLVGQMRQKDDRPQEKAKTGSRF